MPSCRIAARQQIHPDICQDQASGRTVAELATTGRDPERQNTDLCRLICSIRGGEMSDPLIQSLLDSLTEEDE